MFIFLADVFSSILTLLCVVCKCTESIIRRTKQCNFISWKYICWFIHLPTTLSLRNIKQQLLDDINILHAYIRHIQHFETILESSIEMETNVIKWILLRETIKKSHKQNVFAIRNILARTWYKFVRVRLRSFGFTTMYLRVTVC